MFLGFVIQSSMTVFLTIFACVILDFWITKNVTGRYLVGLRWWNEIDRKGNPVYWYESYDYDIVHSHMDTQIFWWGIGANAMFWAIMFLVKCIGLDFLYVRLP